MKRLSTAAKLERESQSTYNRANLDDSNPYVYNYSSDSEPVSERKIQKKRDTYQKIPDDVRVQILESVQNGETLKSAAKRFQINYSSAKSILHTYRKEGRILKKSAQERTIKKRVINDEDEKPTKQAAKPLKKETVKNNKKAVAPLAERITSASTCASYSDEKSSPVQGQDSLVSTLKMEHQADAKSLTLQPMVHEDYNTSPLESYNMNRASRQNGMPMDNFYKSYHYQDMGGDYYRNDMSDYQSNMYSNDFDPLSVLQPRMPKNEEAYGSNTFYYQKGYNNGSYNFEDKTSRTENGLYYEENLENSGNPLKSFMDSQMMLQEALKKTNFWTGSGNQNFRKSSFDMF